MLLQLHHVDWHTRQFQTAKLQSRGASWGLVPTETSPCITDRDAHTATCAIGSTINALRFLRVCVCVCVNNGNGCSD